MKVIIAGSREITDYEVVKQAISNAKFAIDRVVSGKASGVDELGERWAMENDIPIIPFPAPWKLLGNHAGYFRNVAMSEYADALIAVWDGESKGTKHMIDIATKKGLKVYVHKVEK